METTGGPQMETSIRNIMEQEQQAQARLEHEHTMAAQQQAMQQMALQSQQTPSSSSPVNSLLNYIKSFDSEIFIEMLIVFMLFFVMLMAIKNFPIKNISNLYVEGSLTIFGILALSIIASVVYLIIKMFITH